MAASENKRDKRFFTGSTWWPIATGCLTWYAQHRDRVAEPDGFDDLFIGEGWFGIFAGMVESAGKMRKPSRSSHLLGERFGQGQAQCLADGRDH